MREDQDKRARDFIEDYRAAAGLLPALKEVFTRFDGKVFNKRLQTALQEKIGRVCVHVHHYSIDIYTYGEKTRRNITIACLPRKDLIDEKRIPAEKLIESATERRESLLQEAAQLERAMDQADAVKMQIETMRRQLDGILQPLGYLARDIYGLNARISNY